METTNKKYCPLNPDRIEVLPCCKGRCAWWDEDANRCVIMTIAKELSKIRRK